MIKDVVTLGFKFTGVTYVVTFGFSISTTTLTGGMLCFQAVQPTSPWVQAVQPTTPWIQEVQTKC